MVDNESSMVDNESSMVDNDLSLGNEVIEIPIEIKEVIKIIGKRSQRTDLIFKAIIMLCSWRELSIAELAKILERNEKYIKKHYLQRLIEEKKMTYTIPSMPTHPYQKYKTT